MKKYFTILLLLISISAFAQDYLKVKNKFTGKSFRFNTNYSVYLRAEEDTAMYSGWKIEHIKDSSLILSSLCELWREIFFSENH